MVRKMKVRMDQGRLNCGGGMKGVLGCELKVMQYLAGEHLVLLDCVCKLGGRRHGVTEGDEDCKCEEEDLEQHAGGV